MINVWSVSQLLEDTGLLTAEEAKRATPFCLAACSSLSPRLRDEKNEDNPAVIMACAGIALYNYTLSVNAGNEDFSSFKAGDVTISKSASASVENAEKFRDQALLSATPYLTDVDFVFEAVEI